MIQRGSKISLPKHGAVTLVSLQETPEGSWTLLFESDDGSQRSEVLSNDEMDAVTILSDQNGLAQKAPAGGNDEKVVTGSGTQRLNSRALIMSVLGVVVVIAGLVIAFSKGDNGPTNDNGMTKVVADFTSDGKLDGRMVGDESLGLNWRVVSGVWSIESGKLISTQGPSSSIALLDLASLPQSFEVDFREVSGTSGIVFFYEDELNYWKLVAMEGFGTWNVYQIVNGGEPQFKGNTSLTKLAKVKVSLLLNQQEVSILIDGEQRLSIPTSGVYSQSAVGFLHRGRSSTSSVDGKFIVDSFSVGVN